MLVRSFLVGVRIEDPAAQLGFVLKTGTSDMNVVAPVWKCPIVGYGRPLGYSWSTVADRIVKVLWKLFLAGTNTTSASVVGWVERYSSIWRKYSTW